MEHVYELSELHRDSDLVWFTRWETNSVEPGGWKAASRIRVSVDEWESLGSPHKITVQVEAYPDA